MKNKYIEPLMKQFITSIEEIKDEQLKNNKIVSIYNTIFEISKTDLEGFIDSFHIIKKSYFVPSELIRSSDLIISSFTHLKENYYLISDNEEYIKKYSEIIDLIELNTFASQEYILRSLFETDSIHHWIIKSFIKKFEKINWQSIFYSQSAYLKFLDSILDYWKIKSKSVVNTNENDIYSLSITFFHLLLKKTNQFTKEETPFYRKEMLSVFSKLQEKFPNYYWNFSSDININLLAFTHEKIGFLDKYFFDAPKKFAMELTQLKNNENISNFLEIIIYKHSFPYNQHIKDDNIIEYYDSGRIFFYLTIALELKYFIKNSNDFLDNTYEALKIQEIMLKSNKPALYHYFFDKRLNYQVSKISLAFEENENNHRKENFKV